jgi:hypothetical protein
MREDQIFEPPREKKLDLPTAEELDADEAHIAALEEGVVRGMYTKEVREDGSYVIKDKKTGEVLFFEDVKHLTQAEQEARKMLKEAVRKAEEDSKRIPH